MVNDNKIVKHFKNNIYIEEEKEENNIKEKTCECCYENNLLDDNIIFCNTKKHSFCKECVRGYIESNITSNTSTMNCMMYNSTKCCFNIKDIEMCINKKTLETFDEQISISNIKLFSTILDNYYMCPNCEKYGLIIEDKNIKNIKCERCDFEWCKNCKRKYHKNTECWKFDFSDKQIGEKEKLSIKHSLDEIISNALNHTCPHCKTVYIKEEGCNKILCTNCKKSSCYLCGKDITKEKYEHFRKTNCSLYNDQYGGNKQFNIDKINNECKRILDINNDNKNVVNIIKEHLKLRDINITNEEKSKRWCIIS